MKNSKFISAFKIISYLEAISFLVLLFIAMPLKYMYELPQYVSVVGMAHGVLFVLYLVGAYYLYETLNWKFKVLGVFVICSILPFGPFYADRKYLPNNE
jgi:integral membrane protein